MNDRFLILVCVAILLTGQNSVLHPADYTQAQSSENPGIRGGHGMVYDPHNQVVVLFGGMTIVGGLNYLGDTWFFDYATNTWTEYTLFSPSARANFGMVYCNVTNEIIVYGGGQATDTWSFDCETQTWSEVITSTNPGGHHSPAMAYDPQENVVILFGGFNEEDMTSDKTWSFDCDTRTWTELHPSTAPMSRYGHVMTYDETINRIILACGNTATEGHQDDTWTFDASTNSWSEITTIGDPDRLKWPSMTYDSTNQKVILFSGQIGDVAVIGTWVYNALSRTWTDSEPDVSPLGRINTGLAFDSNNGVVILYGGMQVEGNWFSDTWVYDYTTNTWTKLSPVAGTITDTTNSDPTNSNTGPTSSQPNGEPEFPLMWVAVPGVFAVIGVIVIIVCRSRSKL